MKAVIFDSELKFVEDHPVPEPSENEALIRVSMAGICNTDLEIINGYMGFQGIIGHEFAGVVERINGEDQRLSGRRVVGSINCGCGKCEYCRKGLKNHCMNRRVLGIYGKGGSMAEYTTLPIENLYAVPEDVPDEEAVFTEPLAAAFEVTGQVQIKPYDKVLVLGDGKLGLLVSFMLNLSHPDITLVGRHENKLKTARDKNIKSVLLEELKITKSYDLVVESTGSVNGFETALGLVKPRGKIILKSTVAQKKEMNLSRVVVDEITVVGSRCGPFEPALDALSKRLIDVRPLITGIFTFDRAKQAFQKARERDSLKVLVDFR